MTDATRDKTSVRLDKWLWAARFFKTRSQAATAVKGGHVHLNGRRSKSSASVHVGDRLRITKEPLTFAVEVEALAEKRGPAAQARELYTETQDSVDARAAAAAERRARRAQLPHHTGRPDKRDRRALRRFKQNR